MSVELSPEQGAVDGYKLINHHIMGKLRDGKYESTPDENRLIATLSTFLLASLLLLLCWERAGKYESTPDEISHCPCCFCFALSLLSYPSCFCCGLSALPSPSLLCISAPPLCSPLCPCSTNQLASCSLLSSPL
jgi:hypothetical protein